MDGDLNFANVLIKNVEALRSHAKVVILLGAWADPRLFKKEASLYRSRGADEAAEALVFVRPLAFEQIIRGDPSDNALKLFALDVVLPDDQCVRLVDFLLYFVFVRAEVERHDGLLENVAHLKWAEFFK